MILETLHRKHIGLSHLNFFNVYFYKNVADVGDTTCSIAVTFKLFCDHLGPYY